MSMFERRPSPDAERFARALDSVVGGPSTDPDVDRLVEATQALAPAAYPRETWRSTVKERMLRESARQLAGEGEAPAVEAAGGTLDHQAGSAVNVVEVADPTLGRLVLADVEGIDAERAQQIARALADLDARVDGGA